MQLVNDTDRTILIEEDTVVGIAIQAEECNSGEPKQSAGKPVATFKARKAAEMNGKGKKQKPEGQQLPEHLTGLFERSSQGLAEGEKEALKQLLIEYADVFAAHDLDLGCFGAL